jgi:hypothetical protein
LTNSSPTEEEGDYILQLKKETNNDGLRVFVGGQSLSSSLKFPSYPYGAYKVIVEVYRGPREYNYADKPITLEWRSECDETITSSISLSPTYLKPCAKVEFHSTLKTFAFFPYSGYGQLLRTMSSFLFSVLE